MYRDVEHALGESWSRLNKIAEMPNEYTDTMDKNVMAEKAGSRLRFPSNRKRR